MRVLGVAALCVVVGGCVTAAHQVRDRDDYLAEATRVFQGETRERVMKAAETVLRASDPDDFEFRYTLTGFTGLRRYVIYAVIAAANGREKWEFLTEPEGASGIRASISISEAGTAASGYSAQRYENAMASVPLYRLFWNRVDFMLGRRPDWVSCTDATAELEAKQTSVVALGGLCGPTSGGRDAPAPTPLPPMQKNVAPTVAKRAPIAHSPRS